MLNFQPEHDTGDVKLGTNLAAIERHVNDDHYVRGFTPGDFVLDANATHVLIITATPRWAAVSMADAVTSLAAVAFRKPSEWRVGHIRTRFWYTSDVGSTNNFAIQLRGSAIRDGEVVPGTLILDNTAAYAGPAVANTLKRSAYVYTTTMLGNDDELFGWRISRVGGDAADTNVNAFQLVYLEIEHLPAVQVSE